MPVLLADRVQETTTSTGTGNLTLAGAASGYRSFYATFGASQDFYYVIAGGSAWECGIGQISGTDVLVRGTIKSSSNGGSAVDWAAGTKTVFCSPIAFLWGGVWDRNHLVAPVSLSDGASIAVNAALSNNFKVTLGGNRTLANPTNLADGMVLNFVLKQDGTGNRTLAFDTKYDFGEAGTPTLSTGASKIDFVSCYYDSAADKLLCSFRKSA
jgi:hypothetical protein